jgi:hypothetical protein
VLFLTIWSNEQQRRNDVVAGATARVTPTPTRAQPTATRNRFHNDDYDYLFGQVGGGGGQEQYQQSPLGMISDSLRYSQNQLQDGLSHDYGTAGDLCRPITPIRYQRIIIILIINVVAAVTTQQTSEVNHR